jgi:glutaconate CoA-transferase, subunit A
VSVGGAASKVVSLPEAAALVHDGDAVAVQSMATFTAPMALVRELIRQGRRDLTAVCLVGGLPIDWLAAAGCLARVVAAAVSMEQFGLCHQYRKAVERGEIVVEELSETALLARLGAGARGLPFQVTRGLIGTDLIDLQPDNLRVIEDPFGTGGSVVACRALVPDVAVVHAHSADERGNVHMDPTALWPDIRIFPKASRRVIVTVEEIVSEERLRAEPDRVVLPSFAVDAVVHVPFGAHPTSCFPRYGYDAALHRAWAAAARDAGTAGEFLERYVTGPGSHEQYLDVVGGVRALAALERSAAG